MLPLLVAKLPQLHNALRYDGTVATYSHIPTCCRGFKQCRQWGGRTGLGIM